MSPTAGGPTGPTPAPPTAGPTGDPAPAGTDSTGGAAGRADPGAPAGGAGARLVRPFRRSGYRWLAATLALSTFGNGVWSIALVWEVIRIGGGPTALSVVAGAAAVGLVACSLLGGVVADRVPQRLILLVVGVVQTGAAGGAALLSALDVTRVWHLVAVSTLVGVGSAFFYPAYSAWVPSLVPPADLLAVNGFEGMIRPTLRQALGPGAAGLAVGALSEGAALGIAAAATALTVLTLRAIPATAPARPDPTDGEPPAPGVAAVLADLRAGFRILVRTPWLLATLIFGCLMVLAMMGPLQVLVPFLIKERMGGGAAEHAYVMAAFGVSGALASLVTAARPLPRRYLTFMIMLWGAGCLPFVVIGTARHLWQVVAAATVLGAAFSAATVLWGTLLQRRVPAHMLGRVSSLDFFVSISLSPVSMALAGPLAEAIGLGPTFAVAGIAPVLLAGVVIVWARLPADERRHPLDG
ncbi:MFS transporter [Micromonospora rosaria]|uniref:MFS transporter n=1 Tax=Micromonospora rosaria TaxID=47874 RepID=UPI000B15D54E|nr:MFS transporter [Micromonospora rosaria]